MGDTKSDNKLNETILPIIRWKSKAYLEQKEESWRAEFELHYGLNPKFFKLPDRTYEFCANFDGCTHLNRVLTSILPLDPEVCVVGDCVGAISLLCLCQLLPGHLYHVVRQDGAKQAVLNNTFNGFCSTFSGPKYAYSGCEVTSSKLKQRYQQYIEDEKLWGGSRVAIHNSYPWEFFCNFANAKKGGSKHLTLLIYEPPWNKKYNEELR
jgi:hypothetical protein